MAGTHKGFANFTKLELDSQAVYESKLEDRMLLHAKYSDPLPPEVEKPEDGLFPTFAGVAFRLP